MTNEERAKQLTGFDINLYEMHKNSADSRDECNKDCYETALEMAELKDEQFIEFLKNERERYNGEAEKCEDLTTKKFWVCRAATLDVTIEKFRNTL